MDEDKCHEHNIHLSPGTSRGSLIMSLEANGNHSDSSMPNYLNWTICYERLEETYFVHCQSVTDYITLKKSYKRPPHIFLLVQKVKYDQLKFIII